jgi:hypothetical protein
LCDSTPPTGALRVLERDVRDESPTTRAARIPANDAGVCQTFDPERRYERGGSSPPRRLEVRCSIQLSYRRIRHLRARPTRILPLVPSLCPGTLPARPNSSMFMVCYARPLVCHNSYPRRVEGSGWALHDRATSLPPCTAVRSRFAAPAAASRNPAPVDQRTRGNVVNGGLRPSDQKRRAGDEPALGWRSWRAAYRAGRY